MGEPARRTMTVDEFLTWDDGTDTRHELVGGTVVAMAPPSYAHSIIVGNAYSAVRAALEGRAPCQAAVEAGIRLDEANHYKADVAASCADPAGAKYVPDPFLIVEVLSESTWRDDIGGKLQRYIQLPSVREIWLIDSRERWVQVWRRADETWVVTLPLSGNASFASEVLADRVALDGLYRNTGL
jgi:Uma2 family endonuclease